MPNSFLETKVSASGVEVSSTDTALAQSLLPLEAVPITFHTVQNSMATLTDLTQRIAEARPTLLANGVEPTEIGPDYDSDKVEITLLHYSDAAASYLYSQYGSNHITVSTQPAQLAQDAYSRFDDGNPWLGGDRIFDNYEWTHGDEYYCSGGFMVRNTDTKNVRMITAGHCSGGLGSGSSDHHILNGDPSDHRYVGTPALRYFLNNGRDIEFVGDDNTSGVPLVWTGGLKSNDNTGVQGVEEGNPIGENVCTDGSFSGEVCQNTIDKDNQCQSFNDGHTTCHLVEISKESGSCQAGDSGGPTYSHIYPDGNVLARGEIVGYGYATDTSLPLGTKCWYDPLTDVLLAFDYKVLLTTP